MPTILRLGAYRLYFYSHEPNEPPHIHIDRDHASAKFRTENIAVAQNIGFSAKELGILSRIVREHQQALLEAWNEYFRTGKY